MGEHSQIVPKHGALAEALAAAQAEMKRAQKDAKNPHFKSKYATLDSVMDACLPALSKHGIAVTQPVKRIEGETYVVTRLHFGADTLEDDGMPLLVNKKDMQGLGSALTYARRFGLMAMAGVAPADDDGNDAAASPPLAEKAAPAFDALKVKHDMLTAINGAQNEAQLGGIATNENFKRDLARLPEPSRLEVQAALTAREKALGPQEQPRVSDDTAITPPY